MGIPSFLASEGHHINTMYLCTPVSNEPTAEVMAAINCCYLQHVLPGLSRASSGRVALAKEQRGVHWKVSAAASSSLPTAAHSAASG